MRIIDLSISIEDGLPCDPQPQIPHIKYLNHKDTAETMVSYFQQKICTEDLPDGNGWAIEHLELTTHSGTHVDAPYHYYPTMNGNDRAWTIDEVPLDWFIGNGVVLDFRDKADGYRIMPEDLVICLDRYGYKLKPGDIPLICTGADRFWGTETYLSKGAGMSAAATRFLIDQGIRVMGIDAWSWDVPLPLEAEEFSRNKDTSMLWEAHRVGRERAYCHIEKLTNLDLLPFTGFQVICLPVKIKGASAGWCRCIAVLKNE